MIKGEIQKQAQTQQEHSDWVEETPVEEKQGRLQSHANQSTINTSIQQSIFREQEDPNALPKIETNQSYVPLDARAEGGQEIYGCLGAKVGLLNGVIEYVFPISDLNRFNVTIGDRIVGVNGHKYGFLSLRKEVVGIPGTVMQLDVLYHDGLVRRIPVRRVDARCLPQSNGFYRSVTKKNRFW